MMSLRYAGGHLLLASLCGMGSYEYISKVLKVSKQWNSKGGWMKGKGV